jgi:biopolymer transport protein ExbD
MMKRVGVRRARQEDEQLEGAIDIVFLLLIFFVLTSSFQILVGAKIKPPKKVEE